MSPIFLLVFHAFVSVRIGLSTCLVRRLIFSTLHLEQNKTSCLSAHSFSKRSHLCQRGSYFNSFRPGALDHDCLTQKKHGPGLGD